jgi:hypothetical protein
MHIPCHRLEPSGQTGPLELTQAFPLNRSSFGHDGCSFETQTLPLNSTPLGQLGSDSDTQTFPLSLVEGGQAGDADVMQTWPLNWSSSGQIGFVVEMHFPSLKLVSTGQVGTPKTHEVPSNRVPSGQHLTWPEEGSVRGLMSSSVYFDRPWDVRTCWNAAAWQAWKEKSNVTIADWSLAIFKAGKVIDLRSANGIDDEVGYADGANIEAL